MHGDGHTCQPRVQQTIRKLLESKLGGVGGDGNACVSKLTGIGHRVHDLGIRRWLTLEPTERCHFFVPSAELRLHLVKGHIGAVLALGHSVQAKHTAVVAGLANIDLNIATMIAIWIVGLGGDRSIQIQEDSIMPDARAT